MNDEPMFDAGLGGQVVGEGLTDVPSTDVVPAVSEGPGVDLGGGSNMGDMRADTAAMADDWAAGGERADARMRANALAGLDATIPGWQERAEALGLDADLMTWTEAQWTAVTGHEAAA